MWSTFCAAPCHERTLRFLIDYRCVMINIERKLGGIVEPFDQKDGIDLGKRRANASGVRFRLTDYHWLLGQKVIIESDTKKQVEQFSNLQSGNQLKRSPAMGVGCARAL